MKQKNFWPMGLGIAFVSFIAFMMAVITLSIRHSPELVSQNYYAEGYDLKKVMQTKNSAASMGWNFSFTQIAAEKAGMPILEMQVTEHDGVPCDSLTGEIGLYRPSSVASDIASAIIHPLGNGKYFVSLPRELEHGAWQAIVHLKKENADYSSRINFIIEN